MVVMDGHRTTNRVSAGPFCTASNKSGFRGPAVPGLLALFPVRPQSSEQPRAQPSWSLYWSWRVVLLYVLCLRLTPGLLDGPCGPVLWPWRGRRSEPWPNSPPARLFFSRSRKC